jgi:hypothetical protein
VQCQDGLIPSSRNLENLAFLYTCRQIYEEAHLLAFSVAFSITNRWHRTDLESFQAHFASLPGSYGCPIKNLEFATHWRKHHVDAEGRLHFLDSMTDYARFIWNVLEVFPTVEKITITRPSSLSFASWLFHALRLNIEDGLICWKICTDVPDGKIPTDPGKIVLYSNDVKHQRKVELKCQDAPGVGYVSSWPGWYT